MAARSASLETAVKVAVHILPWNPTASDFINTWDSLHLQVTDYASLQTAAEAAVLHSTNGSLVQLLLDAHRTCLQGFNASEGPLDKWRAQGSQMLDELEALSHELDMTLGMLMSHVLGVERDASVRLPGAVMAWLVAGGDGGTGGGSDVVRLRVLDVVLAVGFVEVVLELHRRGVRLLVAGRGDAAALLPRLLDVLRHFAGCGDARWLEVLGHTVAAAYEVAMEDAGLRSRARPLLLRLVQRLPDLQYCSPPGGRSLESWFCELVERVVETVPDVLLGGVRTKGRSMAHLAAEYGWSHLLALCLEHQPELAVQADEAGLLPLDAAFNTQRAGLAVVQLLLRAGGSQPTQLYKLCSAAGDHPEAPEILRLLLDAGAPADSTGADGETAVEALLRQYETEAGQLEEHESSEPAAVEVQRTQVTPGVESTGGTGSGLSGAQAAPETRLRILQDMLRTLIERDAKTSSKVVPRLAQRVQPFNVRWYAELISLLLDHGASPVTTDEQGNTALHHAVLRWNEWTSDMFEILRCLIVPELVLAKNASGQSPLQIACIHVTSYEVIRLLAEAAPSLELDGDTPIDKHPFALCATRWPRPPYAKVGSAGLPHEHAAPDPAVTWGTQGKQFWISLQSVPTELSLEELHLEDCLLDQGKAMPLHFAGRGRTDSDRTVQAECLQLFVDKGMQVPTTGPSGEPLLFAAVAQGNVAVVEQLLRLGADATATNEYGATALFRLCADTSETVRQTGHSRCLRLDPHKQGDPNWSDSPLSVEEQRYMHWQAERSVPEEGPPDPGPPDPVSTIVACLLRAGVDPTVVSGGGMALHGCLRPSGRVPTAVVSQLLDAGVDVDARNSCGETLLHVASSGRDASIVKALLSRGADVDATCELGRNALHHWAAGQGDIAVLQVLLRSGIDPNASDPAGNTPLLLAAQRGSLAAAQALLADPRVNVNAVNHDVESAAYLFALCNCKASTALIRGHGADASVLTKSGQSVLHAAACNQQSVSRLSDLAKAVSSLQVDVVALLQPDADGNTPLHMAAQYVPSTMSAAGPAALHALASLRVLYEAVIEASDPEQAASVLSLANCTTGNSALVEVALRLIRYRSFVFSWTSVTDQFAWLLESSLEHFGDDFDWASPNADGVTPPHFAAALVASSSVRLVQRLIQAGGQLTAADNAGNTVLHYAARSPPMDNVGAVLDLLRDAHDDASVERLVNARNSDGHTCMHEMCASRSLYPCGDLGAMRSFCDRVSHVLSGPRLDKLLDAGADPDMSVHGIPLLLASWYSCVHYNVAEALFDRGADPMRRADPQCSSPALCRSCESVRGKTVLDFPHLDPFQSASALLKHMQDKCAVTLFTLGLAKPRADTPLARFVGHSLFDLNCASLVFGLIDGSPHAIDWRERSERARHQRQA